MEPPRPPRAVVFDLDDTLFDSWRQCVLPAHAEAARAMVAAGLRADPETVARRRLELAGADDLPRPDAGGGSARPSATGPEAAGGRPREPAPSPREPTSGRAPGDLDAEVARLFPCDDPPRAAAAGRRAFYDRDPGLVVPHPFAREVLEEVRRRGARVVLLTTGHPPTQRAKLARLGLGALFDEVLWDDVFGGPGASKRDLLRRFLARSGLAPGDVLVVGDRPGSEVRAALDLGCRALRVRGGEFARIPTPRGAQEVEDVRAVLGCWTGTAVP